MMLIGTILVACFVISSALLSIFSKSKQSQQLTSQRFQELNTFDQVAGNDDLDTEIIWNLQHKGKLNAIKVYRLRAHVGLKEAKAAVETIARGGNATLVSGGLVNPASGGLVDPEKLKSLILNKSKIEAIKYYRQTTGVGLKEAKEAVEWLEEDLLLHDR